MSSVHSDVVHIAVVREPGNEDLPLPKYASDHAAGMDLTAAIPSSEPLVLQPMQRALVSTGLRLAIPPGFEGQVRARSGLATKYGIGVVNSPGTIDADFRGVVHVPLINWGGESFMVERGDRIAQLVIAPVARALCVATLQLDCTNRGEGGFGSTGLKRRGAD